MKRMASLRKGWDASPLETTARNFNLCPSICSAFKIGVSPSYMLIRLSVTTTTCQIGLGPPHPSPQCLIFVQSKQSRNAVSLRAKPFTPPPKGKKVWNTLHWDGSLLIIWTLSWSVKETLILRQRGGEKRNLPIKQVSKGQIIIVLKTLRAKRMFWALGTRQSKSSRQRSKEGLRLKR